jgi:hypothetical protein
MHVGGSLVDLRVLSLEYCLSHSARKMYYLSSMGGSSFDLRALSLLDYDLSHLGNGTRILDKGKRLARMHASMLVFFMLISVIHCLEF